MLTHVLRRLAVGVGARGHTDAARASAMRETQAGVAERHIRCAYQFEPRTSLVPSGVPVHLTFHRESCCASSDVVVFPSLGMVVTLAPGDDVTLALDPLDPGEYAFTCHDGESRGTLVVADQRTGRG